MTITPARHRLLPMLHGSRSSLTCHYRCGDACEAPVPNTSENDYFGDIVAKAVSRRALLRTSALGALAAAAAPVLIASPTHAATPGISPGGLRFIPVPPNTNDTVTVPDGYAWSVVVRWGDPVTPGAPAFDPLYQTPESQAQQFGYNCDYVSLVPLDDDLGLLVVNHEYTDEQLMFANYTGTPTAEQKRIAMMAHGMSVVVIERGAGRGQWQLTSEPHAMNRRITVSTEMRVTGPAAGHPLLRTAADPLGRKVLGTLNDCAGGTTPWGTTLHAEENFNGYFDASGPVPPENEAAFERYGLLTTSGTTRGWSEVDERFDLALHPNEANRFGWIVEIDPYDPGAVPVKRTMLGRMKHEAATISYAADGRAVAYLGDDERFDYLYKFVSHDIAPVGSNAAARAASHDLLDRGTLYVARFDGDSPEEEIDGTGELPADGLFDGTGRWLPLTSHQRSFVPGMTVAEVLVNTRLAADQVGATKMDRPEDVERNPVTGAVYMACTNNTERTVQTVDEANPRAPNRHGHVVEIDERLNDAASTRFTWRIFMLAGDPSDPATYFGGFDKSKVSPISAPDNVAFDAKGNLWISTDGNQLGSHDGLFAVPVTGPDRGYLKQFMTMPVGAETCGPLITPDHRSVFVAVQHPGETEGSTFENPSSSFPDNTIPKPSVVVAWKQSGAAIGL